MLCSTNRFFKNDDSFFKYDEKFLNYIVYITNFFVYSLRMMTYYLRNFIYLIQRHLGWLCSLDETLCYRSSMDIWHHIHWSHQDDHWTWCPWHNLHGIVFNNFSMLINPHVSCISNNNSNIHTKKIFALSDHIFKHLRCWPTSCLMWGLRIWHPIGVAFGGWINDSMMMLLVSFNKLTLFSKHITCFHLQKKWRINSCLMSYAHCL